MPCGGSRACPEYVEGFNSSKVQGKINLRGELPRFENYQNVGWTVGPGITILSRLRITIALPVLMESFDAALRATKGESQALPPWLLFDGFVMNQFRLIAICLGLASSALGTCTSSI